MSGTRICCCALPALYGPDVCKNCMDPQHPPYYMEPFRPLEDGDYKVIDGKIYKQVDPKIFEPTTWDEPVSVPSVWLGDGSDSSVTITSTGTTDDDEERPLTFTEYFCL